jgi:membrane protein implicated in regulation of membrane protease activity
MEVWHLWVLAGIVFLIMEVFTPGFVMGVIGLGCFAGAVAQLLDGNLNWQVGTFAAGVLVGFVLIRPLFLKFFYPKDKGSKTNAEALAGKVGTIIKTIDPDSGDGRVRIGGSDWKAAPAGGGVLPKGGRVKVVSVNGATLLVEPVEGN